jgi:HEPN domain-containing protein
MDRQEELRQWFSLAEQNLNVAEHLANNMHPMPVETICNNCQQSAEKDLKGFLFNNNVAFPKIHDLSELVALCIQVNPEFVKLATQCRFLNNFGVLPRYPHELQITDDDARIAIRFAEEVRAFVKENI